MKKCIIIPDSFKGTMCARQVCDVMQAQVKHYFPDCEIHAIPVADGGEGTVDCFLYASDAEKVTADTTGPFGEPLRAYYARIGDTAVIETASAAGLTLVEGKENPRKTTTYGVGTLIGHAVRNGCRKILIGLGGSCTNDGGVGMARALGTRFYDENGCEFAPDADELMKIRRIDNQQTQKLLSGVTVLAMCDIDNPLCGEAGASYVFAPQKGADPKTVEELDENLKSLSEVIRRSLGVQVEYLPGAGAAGGLGAGCVAFLGGTLKAGIEAVLDLVSFDSLLEDAELVFTGEGRLDSQSLRGKVIMGIAKHAKKKSVPVIAVVGAVADGMEAIYQHGVTAVFSINQAPIAFAQARHKSAENLKRTMDSILRLYQTAQKRNMENS